ncbi:DNA-directed RNA polymerase, subunit E'/Rpb8 [Indivirus ILV1]|uniref:DNA-directed RNA polymerase, subunit E'/Rpb8 n=1 Tax=Indivirus ILV1 TaxID=1977633 RepID=A0A1V0SDL3_9VIRU|nr:DNA-directed RNA polymerase, subunit E'/Rpb8 [Indivirus ILV1]
MTSPYINTKLSTSVLLHPYQMDNKIYLHLKKNLENKLVGRCFSKYGYVVKVIEILSYKDGVVEAENTESSALFDIEFSCKICAPLRNTTIICQIDKINKLLITAINGPILIVITNDRVNDKSFFKDKNNNIRYKKGETSEILKSHDFIKVTLQTIQFYDGDEKIKAIGFIEEMASDEETKNFYSDQYKEINQVVEFEEYTKDNQ